MHIGVKVQRLNLQHEATRPLIEFFVYLSIKSWRLFIEGVLFFPAGWESFPGRPRWRVHQRVHHSHESNPLQAHLEQERRRRGPQSRGDKTSFYNGHFISGGLTWIIQTWWNLAHDCLYYALSQDTFRPFVRRNVAVGERKFFFHNNWLLASHEICCA